jgi:glycogen debranching enzyme
MTANATSTLEMPDLDREKHPFYILASSAQADERTRVLKHGDTFAVFDHYGDIKLAGMGEEGLFHEGIRFLSGWMLALDRERPLFLSSTIKEDNDLLAVDLTNPDLERPGQALVPRDVLHLARSTLLWDGACYVQLSIRNYGQSAVTVPVTLLFEADFADIFEVRGMRRARRGQKLDAEVRDGEVVLGYEGLDEVVRRTRLQFAPRPAELSGSRAVYPLTLRPRQEIVLEIAVSCLSGTSTPRLLSYHQARGELANDLIRTRQRGCAIETSREAFNDLLNRSASDLHMMTTRTDAGLYPYAGVPWFSTPFGRDGIVTALECLGFDPELARGVLGYLAQSQATEVNPQQDAEPGKILHETRRGEMAALGEIPFGRYYGSIDATPLFIVLAGAYYERTGDRAFIESIWPNIERALDWIDTYGDVDGDGFVEYQRRSSNGLGNQGWKDSHDAIFHADGTLASAPIALCEVQGYVFAARTAAAELAALLGHTQHSEELLRQARDLRERFERAFWCPELGTYALALDGEKRACRVKTSNAGHCLFAGIASTEHAGRVTRMLLGMSFFSGWGVRTVSDQEARYNPMSYHNGSIWPHDNALIAAGLACYGHKEGAVRILTALFDASQFLDLHRLPELYCGFPRRPAEGPTLYPVACAPQAWSAASVFLVLQACLGLSIQGAQSELLFSHPLLPEFLQEVRLKNLRVGAGTADLLLIRHGDDVSVNVLRREGDVRILMVK